MTTVHYLLHDFPFEVGDFFFELSLSRIGLLPLCKQSHVPLHIYLLFLLSIFNLEKSYLEKNAILTE